MKHFVFLTNQYLPMPGATGVCVHQVAKYLSLKGNDVSVICYGSQNGTTCIDGVKVHSIKVPDYLFNNTNKSKIRKRIDRIHQLFDKLIHVRNYPLRSLSLVKGYCRVLEKILINCPDTTIVATYTPFEAVLAVSRIKRKYPGCKTVYYSLDTLSNELGGAGFLSVNYRKRKGMLAEKKMFSVFDRVVVMECHKQHYFSNDYKDFKSKMYVANFPLLVVGDSVHEKNTSKNDNFSCKKAVFAGTFYRNLRNPTFLCEVLKNVEDKVSLNVTFLGGGDCQDILENLRKNCPKEVCVLGMQPHDVARSYVQSADILISVGNVDCPMAPSKIYEYMATGKPIIHTYSYPNDPCIEPLKKYGNALLIRQSSVVDYNAIENFINDADVLDLEKVVKTFETSTPAYTASILDF